MGGKQPRSRVTCEVLGLEVQVAQLVDVADVHVLLVHLRLVEVLGFQSHQEESSALRVVAPTCKNPTNKVKSEQTTDDSLTIRLTEPPIFLVSISSPFMQSLRGEESLGGFQSSWTCSQVKVQMCPVVITHEIVSLMEWKSPGTVLIW